eukprot:TRINITY_DN1424_c2_g1_i1.p1 TRINITY_DN1424_c2_g1~~TRINITY_DN1424_c2_g1_i1.p1  ORF type:complete len:156 (-),score=73.90 TRINITY_DN1424_c2_g1_i1:61-528(-)
MFRISKNLNKSCQLTLLKQSKKQQQSLLFKLRPFSTAATTNEEWYKQTETRIKEQISENKCVLYMKGTPKQPQCGFSATVIRALEYVGAKNYVSFNILEDPELREGIKIFSDWPTIPQLYIGGEFVGGADIVKNLVAQGELASILEKAGVELETK